MQFWMETKLVVLRFQVFKHALLLVVLALKCIV